MSEMITILADSADDTEVEVRVSVDIFSVVVILLLLFLVIRAAIRSANRPAKSVRRRRVIVPGSDRAADALAEMTEDQEL
jgi:hypothetical protein